MNWKKIWALNLDSPLNPRILETPTSHLSKSSFKWVLVLLLFGLSACYQTKAPSPEKIDTVVLLYETAEDRKAFQAWLKNEHLETRLLHTAGGKAEYVIEEPDFLDPELTLRLRDYWQEKYQITIQKNHIILNCCQP